jgi:16S rRNA (adenine(1408)-N(1))-methyltransferase
VSIDVGTGDGRAVLAAAAREPTTLALGIDANAAAMAEASRRAGRPARRGGLPNAGFVLAAAESLPPTLAEVAQLVTVQFPWGSLLRGVVGREDDVAAGIAGLVAPGGSLQLLLAPAARDGLDGIPLDEHALADAVRDAFERGGLTLTTARCATPDEVRASQSTWARRLGSSPDGERVVMLMRLCRCP